MARSTTTPTKHIARETVRVGLALMACPVLLFLTAGTTGAAPADIRQGIRMSDTVPSGANEQVVREYIEHSYAQLTTEKGKQVRAACDALSEPLRSEGSRIFKKAYSTMLGGYFQKAMSMDDVLVRINVMIAVKNFTDKSAVTLISAGLADDCPAVRLHAGRAVSLLADQESLDAEDPGTVLQSLKEACEIEPFQRVLEQLLEALAALTTRDAGRVLLDAINRRVRDHDLNPGLPMQPEFDALTRQFRRFINATLKQPPDVPIEWARRLTLVAYRYLYVSSGRLHRNDGDARPEQTKLMIKLCDKILHSTVPWVAGSMNVKIDLPASISTNGGQADWLPEALLGCAELEVILKKLGFTAGQLDIPGGEVEPHDNGVSTGSSRSANT